MNDQNFDIDPADEAAISEILRSQPRPTMPESVFERLQAVVRSESERRSSGRAEAEEAVERAEMTKRNALGTFGNGIPGYADKQARPVHHAAFEE